MAKNKEVNTAAKANGPDDGIQPMLITLADQLGTFLGRMQAKADNLLEDEQVQQQLTEVRDVAAQLLERVTEASKASRKSAAKTATTVKSSTAPAEKAAAAPSPTPQPKMRSGGTVDAPGKRHRKPPPQEKFDPRLGELRGKHAGRKQFKVGMSRGRA
jgi:hypothetical protein